MVLEILLRSCSGVEKRFWLEPPNITISAVVGEGWWEAIVCQIRPGMSDSGGSVTCMSERERERERRREKDK